MRRVEDRDDNARPMLDPTPMFDAPCDGCGVPVTVTAGTLEAARFVNARLRAMGTGADDLIRKTNMVKCRECYLKHHAKIWDKERRISDHVCTMWGEMRSRWRNAKNDEQRSDFEEAFRKGSEALGYWQSYSGLVAAWLAEQKANKGGRQSVDKAGF